MTPAQRRMYFAEVKKATAAMRERGHAGTDDELRHALTREALGVDLSSSAFSEHQLDLVMAVIWSHSQPGDLDRQLRQLDQPKARLEFLCRAYLRAADIREHGLDWYLIAMAKRMRLFGPADVAAIDYITEQGWQTLLPECNQQRLRVERRKLKAAPF